jgi:16S rRNA (cytidine1402-2'-O)-methyltransferase
MASRPKLIILGMPLVDDAPLSSQAIEVLQSAERIIGESRKTTQKMLARIPGGREKPFTLLDESSRPEEKNWKEALNHVSKSGGTIVLFSDTGMPLLFDPGREVVEAARSQGFEIQALSGPTSWGSAAALSGWLPPFLIAGFPPRENRSRFWLPLKQLEAHCVLMERPYAFLGLLKECGEVFGKQREAFLAWELDSENQKLIWANLGELQRIAATFSKTKGEFVLVVQGITKSTTKRNFS